MKLALLALIALPACRGEPATQQIVTDREGVGTPNGEACQRLREVGCVEGFPKNGRTCFEHLQERGNLNIPIPTDCIVDAGDRESVRRCGTDLELALTFRCRDAGP